ncbi:hypothetical protein ACFE04_023443 [Oxalis oulophora]
MVIIIIFLFICLITSSSFSLTTTSEKPKVPKFAFSWSNDNNIFEAGEVATIMIKLLGNFDDSLSNTSFNPLLIVNDKMGNSCYVSTVASHTNDHKDTGSWKIIFTPIMAGLFNVVIQDDPFQVFDSSLHYNVLPGQIYPSVCVASWMGMVNEFEVGTKAELLILPKDAFGNNVSLSEKDPNSYNNFTISVLHENSSMPSVPNITYIGWKPFGYIVVEFIMTEAGNLSLLVKGGNRTLVGSPLPFTVKPGPLEVSNCIAKLKFETASWQLYSRMEIFIYQQDRYGNLVSGLYPFDADVVEKETNLTMPVADLQFEEVEPGIQLFSFSLHEPGNFLLTISNTKHNKTIIDMPYAYTVFIGYCDGFSSVVNGSGLNDSIAGETVEFSVYLYDKFQYPSPVELKRLWVLIGKQMNTYYAVASIVPFTIFNGTGTAPALQNPTNSRMSVEPNNTSRALASAFKVTYTPTKRGIYEIRVFCGNIQLNGGNPFTKEVKSGEVNISMSGAVNFTTKVRKQIRNEVVVHLMDSYENPVQSQESRLNLEIASLNHSGFSSWMFTDNNNGSYTGYYLPADVGTYEMCVSFDRKHIPPCPFGINVYSSEYFPQAYDDTVSVWEDESIAVDVLGNDYFAGHNASIIEFSYPDHGSLLQSGQLLRYTPYKDYFGNDSFFYTICDVNGNVASAVVNIFVLTTPPQFISFPSQLQTTEDVIGPRFGGFSGFQIRYSDLNENISVTLSAKSGTIFLSPMLMQFRQPIPSGLAISIRDHEALILEGYVTEIISALQSLQYLGNENFYGNDSIRVSTKNRNGVNHLNVPVLVTPINDPPFISVPEFIILKGTSDKVLVFDRKKDQFEFAIGDPDLHNYPGGELNFTMAFSMEVSDGLLETRLPADLINTTELKLANSYNQWQPIQTYVSISKHFTVKASGIRFRGSINHINNVLQHLYYHSAIQEGEYGVVLSLKVDDLGNYGCYPDCAENISTPLYAAANVHLIRGQPMSSLVAHVLGSVIMVEFIIVLTLGVVLLFFTCKCAILLVKERKGQNSMDSKPSQIQNSSGDLSEDVTYFGGSCSTSTSFSLRTQASNFRQRIAKCFESKKSPSDLGNM